MMKKLLMFSMILILTLNSAFSQTEAIIPFRSLCNPNASREAIALYMYLQDMKGKKILSGQQDSPWGIDEFEYIKTNTGKQPAIKGMDFISQRDNDGEVQKAIDWWKAGGIPTIMWHWGAPSIGEGYEASKKPIEIENCFIEGTAENKAFWAELKMKGDLLQKLKDANVPVIWRPFHELNGNWFWWGKQGPEKFKKLWITMFNYFNKERGLNNLIWTLCYTGQPDANWYPGDQYVDIAGADTYVKNDSPQINMYNKVKTIINNRGPITPIAFHECGIPPNPDQCLEQGCMWSWWMEWHTSYLQNLDKVYLKFVYDHDLVITLDKIPDIMATYGPGSRYYEN
jgi:beta-mannanase